MNADAEGAVLGAIIIDPSAYWRVADLIGAEDFTRAEYAELWRVVGELSRQGVQADVVTVGERSPHLVGLAAELANVTPGSGNIRSYAEAVSRNAVCRRVRAAGKRIQTLPATVGALGEAQAILAACAPRQLGEIKPASAFLSESVARMQSRVEQESSLTGVPTGWPKLDWLTGGWQRGDLIILAARPSIGKTAIALQTSLNATQFGHPALILSLEMTGSQLTDRALAHLGKIDSLLIRQPKRMQQEDWTAVTDAGARLSRLPLRIDDSSALTIDALCARIRQADAMERLGLVAIDYLTQITPPKAETQALAVQIITRQLKALAKQLQLPIILCSQLNRALSGRPKLENLRESGAIEQDADIVILLHRPDDSKRERLEMHLAKQRNGPCGELQLYADLARQCFTETEWHDEPTPTKPRYARGMRSVTLND